MKTPQKTLLALAAVIFLSANAQATMFLARPYDPSLQRWITRDPIGELGGINLHTFVGNNPVNRIDPWGLAFGDWWDPRTYSPGYARLSGDNALYAQSKAAGYTSYSDALDRLNEAVNQERGVDVFDDPYLDQRLANQSLQTIGDVTGEAANLYLAAATSVSPTGAGSKCVSLLLPGGKVLGQAGSKATIRELQGGLKEAQALFEELAQGGKVLPNSTFQGTLVQLPNGGTVGLRTVMTKSPGTVATIDVDIPGIAIDKIKFNP